MTDGRLKGGAVSGERQRGTGVAVTVDDRWRASAIAKSMTMILIPVAEKTFVGLVCRLNEAIPIP